ncbi:MAG: WecB/TagA/CpsF family glycosyltransferase [bacterium]|nr:WecB/TagA/CpsF family glycosyltransferase [bacterium]
MANILGVNTGNKTWSEATDAISSFYNDEQSHLLVTPNPEIILTAINDEELFYILNKADLSLADGFGLKIAALLSGQQLHRVTGADLLPHLLSEAESNQRKIVIINRQDGLSSAEDIYRAITKKYPHLKAKVLDSNQTEKPSREEIEIIRKFQPALAICLLGSPYQEKYIYHLSVALNKISLLTGLGGAFDFITGKIKRATTPWRRLGLEWLWRLIQQPSRWRRIWQATAVFTTKVLHWIFILPNLYRPNVAIILFRKNGAEREVLIVERQGETGHWQLPQGGLDGLDIEASGLKELEEETGVTNVRVNAIYKNLYKYSFNKELGKYFNPNSKRHFGYKGQRQSLLIAEFLGKDEEIKINHWDHQAWRWVAESRLIESIHTCRREACKIYIQKLIEMK